MKKIINITLLILWMILIFTMSSFNATESGEQSGFIVNILSNVLHISNIEILSLIVRKLAHFTEYLILGILAINCFKDYDIKHIFIISLIFCIIYASSDEIHQLFIPGRSGNIIDATIDSLGALTGITMYYYLILKNKAFKKIS